MERSHAVSESEMEILRVLWQAEEPLRLAPLMEALETQGKRWKPNTVLTFLTRLHEKGMVEIHKEGRFNTYVASLTEEAYMASLTQSFVRTVYGGDAKELIAALMRQERITRKDMDELQVFWEEAHHDA